MLEITKLGVLPNPKNKLYTLNRSECDCYLFGKLIDMISMYLPSYEEYQVYADKIGEVRDLIHKTNSKPEDFKTALDKAIAELRELSYTELRELYDFDQLKCYIKDEYLKAAFDPYLEQKEVVTNMLLSYFNLCIAIIRRLPDLAQTYIERYEKEEYKSWDIYNPIENIFKVISKELDRYFYQNLANVCISLASDESKDLQYCEYRQNISNDYIILMDVVAGCLNDGCYTKEKISELNKIKYTGTHFEQAIINGLKAASIILVDNKRLRKGNGDI